MRVVVTGAHGDNRLSALLQRLGATVLELPAIAIQPPEDLALLDKALDHLAGFNWIAFTSRNAVHAVLDRMAARPRNPFPSSEREGLMAGPTPYNLSLSHSWERGPGGEGTRLRVAAVGPSTASELEARGVPVHCVPEETGGAALAAAMAELGVAGARVLLPVGDLSRPDLKDGLRRAGAEVEEVVVYRTVRPSGAPSRVLEALRRGEVEAVTLLSPSAIRNLVEMMGPDRSCLRDVRLICIGPTTASAVRELTLEPAAVSAEQSLEALVRALVACCTTERFHERN